MSTLLRTACWLSLAISSLSAGGILGTAVVTLADLLTRTVLAGG